MEKLKLYLPSIVFNVAEVSVIFLIGRLLKLSWLAILIIFILFVTIRIKLGGAMHYKSPYKCAIWSLLVFLSLFTLTNAGWIISIIMTCFCAFILTTKGNINDGLMWGGNKLNQCVFDWIKFNQNNIKLKEYEERLKETDNKKYIIFIYRFREFKSYSDISKLMDIDIQRISEEIKIMSHFIEYSIRLGGE